MGIYDRQYYQDDSAEGWRGGGGGGGAWTIVTWLIVINCVVFVIDGFSQQVVIESTGQPLSRWVNFQLAVRGDTLAKPWTAWRLLTYGFAHTSLGQPRAIWHLLFNMLGLWFFGRELEARLGRGEFLRYYLAAIVFAGLAWLLAMNLAGGGAGVIMLGASGGVAAVVILFALYYPRRTVYLYGVLAVPAWLLGVLFVGMDLLGALSGGGGVAYTAHLGGAAMAGLYWYFQPNLTRLSPTDWLGRFMRSGRRPRRSNPNLKLHEPSVDPYEESNTRADAILEKLHRQGESSLTAEERHVLEEYSRRMRQKHR